MARYIALDAVFFLLPFALYAAWLIVTRGTLRNLSDWQIRTIAYLTIAGSGILLAVILTLTSLNPAPSGGTYVPAHVENGVIVPAHTVPPPAK